MKRLFTLILVLFCLQEVKGQILWERIETDRTTFFDDLSKVLIKDSLIYLQGNGTWMQGGPSESLPVFYACYNLDGKLKWWKAGKELKYKNGGGDLIIDSDSMLATYSLDQKRSVFHFQQIRMATGDTLPSRKFLVPPTFKNFHYGFLRKDPDGGYVLGTGGQGPQLTKLDDTGRPLWTKTPFWNVHLPQSGEVYINGLFRNKSHNYVITTPRNYSRYNLQTFHPTFLEISPSGDSILKQTIVLERKEFYEQTFYGKMFQTRDGSFLFAGYIDTVVNNHHGDAIKYFVAKADAQFNLEWTYIFKGKFSDYGGGNFAEMADGSYAFLAGNYKERHYAVFKFSKYGDYLTHTTYESADCRGLPMIRDWKVLPDGTAIIAGKCKNHGYSYLARIADVGIPVDPMEEDPITIIDPNDPTAPASGSLNAPADLYIYDLTGRMVKQMVVKESDIKKLNIDVPAFSGSILIYKLITQDGKVSTRKVPFMR